MASRQVKLKQAEPGSILYHYTKSNGINGIVNHNCFWATKSDFLNDPDEFSYITRIIEAVCEANVIDYHGFVIYDPEQQKRLIRKIISDYLPELFQTPFERILEAGEKNPEDQVYRKACRKFQKIAAVYAMFFKHEAFREENLPVKEIMVAPQNHIDLAKKGMEYMMKSKGYRVPVHLSDIKLRY